MRGSQGRLDAEWPASSDLICDFDRSIERRRRRSDNFLHRAHAIRLLSGPMIPSEDIAHGIPPTGFAHEPHSRTASRKAPVCVLILTEICVRGYRRQGTARPPYSM